MKMKLQVFSSKRKEVKVAFLASLLLVAFTLMPIVFADPETPQNITVETAYSMIDGGSFPDLAILDVRNQSEYDINHLYNAILIPLHELETRIGELAAYINTEIIIYCGLGGRSEIASGILADNGFTKVYNMLGGITAWIESEYPVYATYHNVTVDITGNNGVHVEIEPLLVQMGCTSCGENHECPNESEITNIQITVLE
jgi:rhodanese-related sulfurtransferase